jgi:MFS family permease
VASRLQPLVKLARNPSLRRTAIGCACFNTAEFGEWIAVLVYAYEHGGASASGLLAFAMLAPCVLIAPLTATFSDRYQPGLVLAVGFAIQAVAFGILAAALLAHAPTLVVYGCAIVVAPTLNLTRPTLNVLLPQVVHTPEELTAANAAIGWVESGGVVVGPLAAALAITFGGPGTVVAVFAALMALSTWVVWPLTTSLPPVLPREGGSPVADALEGVLVLRHEGGTTTLLAVLTSQSLFVGAMDVLFVVLAISELGTGSAGVGVLNAAFGAGGLLAVFLTLGLVGRARLAPSMIGATLVMGGSIALIAAWPRLAVALVLVACANLARSLFDVSGRTLLQRTSSPEVLGRIFGMLEAINMLGLALGSLLVPVLIAIGGNTAAIVGVGAVMPLVTLVLLPAILGADARATVPIVEIGLLRALSLFRPLPPPELEGVARTMQPLVARAGDVLIREGAPGDLFYIIADGTFAVSTAAGYRTQLAHGDGFGEIALLYDTPRTATVTAVTDAHLYALSREHFLTAVTGAPEAHHAARRLADDRLAEQTVAPIAFT